MSGLLLQKGIKMRLLLLIFFTCGLYSQTMHTVNAGSMYFQPQDIVVNEGDSVEFINDGGYHDVVITSGPEMLSLPACSGPCYIGILVFNSPGSYDYECSIGSHASQGMVGTITVNAVDGSADVQIVHNSPYPTVDIYVNEELAIEAVPYRESTGLVELPLSNTIGIAPTGESVVASFPVELTAMQKYVVVATGIVGDSEHPLNLFVSSLQEEAVDDEYFSLKVMHGVTDAPSVDIYANGDLLVENLSYGEFQGYVDVLANDYTLDITLHGETTSVASFSAPLSSFGGMSGVVYASGFLNPAETDSSFTLILTTPSGYVVTLPSSDSSLSTENPTISVPNDFALLQNFPNPFNPNTSIAYHLQTSSPTSITIYDLMGNTVKDLFSGLENPGYKSINWDATDNNGDLVSSGMYFYKLQVGESFDIKRMMYLK